MDLLQLYQRALKVSATAIVFGTNSIYDFAETMREYTGGMFVVVTEDLLEPNSEKQVGVFETISVYVSNSLKDGYYFKY